MTNDGIARHTPELTGTRAIRLIEVDIALLPFVGEVLTELTNPDSWLAVQDNIDDIVTEASLTVSEYYNQNMIGSVHSFIALIPDGWLLLDGATHDKVDYPELWEVLPGDLKSGTDFTLPDLDMAFIMGGAVEADIGDSGGENTTNLTVGQLPSHSHLYTPPVLTIDAETPAVPIPTAGLGTPTQTGTTGSGDDIENRPAYVTLLYAVFAGRT